MISIKQWMELANFRITEGSDFGWQCFGSAYTLDAWDGDNENGWSMCIVFSPRTQAVYQVEAHDYKRSNAYRYTNPDFRKAYEAEEKARGAVDFGDYRITELEVQDDWESKAFSIVNYADYDEGILVPLDLTDEELLPIFKLAHEAGMSFNDYVNLALRKLVDERKATSFQGAIHEDGDEPPFKGCEC
jgi:hypothetical protein